MNKDPKLILDPVERSIAELLNSLKINYIHDSEKGSGNLDFYLPDHDLHIECKAFYSERIIKQIKDKRNVIVVQGYKSADFLRDLLKN